jgi:2-polyprenyl-3-methyl-5-hydroxy-6-metoxy-1,4-benzoquinol methylase
MNNQEIIDPAGGNIYPKSSTQNPIARYLLRGYYFTLDSMVYTIDPLQIHEVGCGEGYLISRYDDGKRILLGSDQSDQIINKARGLTENKQIQYKTASIYDLQENDSAPLIICCEVLEHLEFPERALDILSRLANPYLVTSVPQEPLWRILNLLRGSYISKLGNTPGHVQHWSKTGFIKFLERRFEIIAIKTPLPWLMALCRSRK